MYLQRKAKSIVSIKFTAEVTQVEDGKDGQCYGRYPAESDTTAGIQHTAASQHKGIHNREISGKISSILVM